MFTINCRGKLVSLHEPIVMGIINVTPDSFYEGHLDKGTSGMVALAEKMIADGATILDIGGQSTRPGSERINADEEINRVIPVIEAIHKKFPNAVLSIDTYQSKVAEAAVRAGAAIINDISGGNLDSNMIATAAALQTPYICMHMKGEPATMQQHINYENVTMEVLDFFIAKLAECKNAGIRDLIIDPGFGFGKKISHNFQLLKELSIFKILDRPILAGLSRKSSIYKTLNTTADKALNGTTALNMLALQNGASILRVHDVKEAMECVQLFNAMARL